MRGLLRLYVPPLPRSVFTLQVGGLVNAFGNGMVIPFMFIYLHNVRGIALGVAGLVIGTHAVVSIVAGPVFGSQIDRFGGKRMLALSLVILTRRLRELRARAHGLAGLPRRARERNRRRRLLAVAVDPHHRPHAERAAAAAFAMQRVVMNLGIGLGALTGGFIAATDSPGTFVALFLADAVTFLGYAVRHARARPRAGALRTGTPAARRAATATCCVTGRSSAVIALNALFIFAGFSGFDVLPVYAKNEAGLSENQIGLLFFLNTVVIVLAQLPRRDASSEGVAGCRRSRCSGCSGLARGSSSRSPSRASEAVALGTSRRR